MKIEGFRCEAQVGKFRTVATVTWEDCNRGKQELYFETGTRFVDDKDGINPHAFLVACILPAMRHGERRVAINADICPELKLGLMEAMRLLQFWYGPGHRLVVIESGSTSRFAKRQTPERAGFFFTGGIDSLATLRCNRMSFENHHPGYFRDGLLIFGLEVDRLESFDCVVKGLSALADEAGITIVPIYTNVRYLDDDWSFWSNEFEAAVLASAAHSLNQRLSSVSVGSSFDYEYLHPHGSHPLLDPQYGSSDLRIRHDGVSLSRLAKTRMLADWDLSLKSLRVCNRSEGYRPGILNCGSCEKCLRTLTALLILGKLDKAVTFASREVTPDLIAANVVLDTTSYPFWPELVEPLEEQRRDDLASAVRMIIARYRGEVGWRGSIKKFDRRHLNGSLRALTRTIGRA